MTDAASVSLHGIANHSRGNPMNLQLTQIRAQHHIADLQRAADHRWPAATTDAEPAKPRRKPARQRWIVLSLVTDRRRG